ncbi:MAG: AF1514 family protein [Thermodesulfobacteriota bacterium]|jgi:hypothetical protein|uniref:DUF5619 domain-containing protein n=1 Tax=Desulfoglaeba alkanexedens ALDC TaxID=980445 RepID=A0A4P8L3S8_9BACT|nr:AF1514 family protein [Desulfoglaeba alkanexedens]MDY6908572.1 AF1514 family protein [Thermodesulfobacteriota bacterium]QCQ22434.1 hypothetical protein FDQ92_09840 [Desulfoglaeba alkanexedens ALDC]
MTACKALTREMLSKPIDVRSPSGTVDFQTARRLAEEKARERLAEPMLLAWYDREAGTYSPKVECCDEHKPGWLVYAESRGGDVTVSVDREAYVFVFRSGP